MPRSPITPDDDATPDVSADMRRDELNEAAADAGVPNAEELPNKEAVVEAIEGPNPALAPIDEASAPGEKTWKVIGPHRVCDTAPGGEFTAGLAALGLDEYLLIQSGHIIQVQEKG